MTKEERRRAKVERSLRRSDEHEARRALRKAALADAPLWLKALSALRLVALLVVISLALTASVWLLVAYAVSVVSKAIRS